MSIFLHKLYNCLSFHKNWTQMDGISGREEERRTPEISNYFCMQITWPLPHRVLWTLDLRFHSNIIKIDLLRIRISVWSILQSSEKTLCVCVCVRILCSNTMYMHRTYVCMCFFALKYHRVFELRHVLECNWEITTLNIKLRKVCTYR